MDFFRACDLPRSCPALVCLRRGTAGSGTFASGCDYLVAGTPEEDVMNGLIYLVGLIVVIMAVLSLLGLR